MTFTSFTGSCSFLPSTRTTTAKTNEIITMTTADMEIVIMMVLEKSLLVIWELSFVLNEEAKEASDVVIAVVENVRTYISSARINIESGYVA